MRRVVKALCRYPWVRWAQRSPRLGPWAFTCRLANAGVVYLGPICLSVPMPYSRVFLEGTARSAPWLLPKKSGIRAALGLTVLLVLVGWPAAASAQAAMVNPTKVAWDADAEDRAVTTRYELGYFVGTAAEPVQTVSIALSATAPSGASWQAQLPKAALGLFTVRLKACGAASGGGEVCSDWSNATDPFRLTPKPPAGVRTAP